MRIFDARLDEFVAERAAECGEDAVEVAAIG